MLSTSLPISRQCLSIIRRPGRQDGRKKLCRIIGSKYSSWRNDIWKKAHSVYNPFIVRTRYNTAVPGSHSSYFPCSVFPAAHSREAIAIPYLFPPLLSGVSDFFDRNKILSGYDLSHYQVPHCIRVFFYFVWFVFIHHNFQFYFKLCTYCNILDIYLSWNLNFVNYLLFYMKLLNYLFFNMFGSVLECC